MQSSDMIAFKYTFPFDKKWHSNHAESALLLYVWGRVMSFLVLQALRRVWAVWSGGVSVSRSDT